MAATPTADPSSLLSAALRRSRIFEASAELGRAKAANDDLWICHAEAKMAAAIDALRQEARVA
jgi:hypothetical protein